MTAARHLHGGVRRAARPDGGVCEAMPVLLPKRHVALAGLLLLCAAAGPACAGELVFELAAASGEHFAEPHDIVLAPDGRTLYVADNGNDRIVRLDAQSLAMLGELAVGEVSQPHDVAFDAEGRLLVADTGNSRIAIYEVTDGRGRLVDELSERIRRPEGVAVHADGRVFATGAASNNLVVYRDGKVIGETGGFASPHDVEFDPGGAAWVADANNDRMVRLNDALAIDREWSGPAYGFRGPRYMDFDSAGRMFVADKYSNRVKIIDAEGVVVGVLGEAQAGKGAGRFDRPEGVEIRGSDVWFADTYNDRIVRYRVEER